MDIMEILQIIFFVGWFCLAGGLLVVAAKFLDAKKFETRRLYFAAVVLSGIGLIFVLAMGALIFLPEKSQAATQIFDACKTLLPPIVTLVLGFYFGQENEPKGNEPTPGE